MRILLADSDAQFVKLLQSYLLDRGHEAEIASYGPACGTLLREFHPDVLVLESQRPLAGADEVLAPNAKRSWALVHPSDTGCGRCCCR